MPAGLEQRHARAGFGVEGKSVRRGDGSWLSPVKGRQAGTLQEKSEADSASLLQST